jgi:hypothetical protein
MCCVECWQIFGYSPSGRINKPLRDKIIFYKQEYNTVEEISALITERPVFGNLSTLKETPTDDGTDIWSAEPNMPECDVESVTK